MDATNAFSLLLTCAELRRTLREDPARLGTRLDLSHDDLEALKSLDFEQLERQAEGYLLKRFDEMGEQLPRSLRLIGPMAWELFVEYAESNWPRGHRRHLLDAIGFADFARERGHRINVYEVRRLKLIQRKLAQTAPKSANST